MDVPYAAPVWRILPRTPSSLWLEMNVCTCTSLMNEGPASLLMDINCWPIGTEDICFYSSETQNPPTSKDKLNVLEWLYPENSVYFERTVWVILFLIWQMAPLSSKSSFLIFNWHKTLTHSYVCHHLDLSFKIILQNQIKWGIMVLWICYSDDLESFYFIKMLFFFFFFNPLFSPLCSLSFFFFF